MTHQHQTNETSQVELDGYSPPPWSDHARDQHVPTAQIEDLIAMTRFSARPESDDGTQSWIGYESVITETTPLRVARGSAMMLAEERILTASKQASELGELQLTREQRKALEVFGATTDSTSFKQVLNVLATTSRPYTWMAETFVHHLKTSVRECDGRQAYWLALLTLWIA